MNFVRRTALSSAALTLILASTVQAAEEKVLAVVGGTAITESALVAYGQMRMGGNAPGRPAARAHEGENDWPSIKSPGSKSDG